MFDPDSKTDPLCCGFTSCDPDDLPTDTPSRALSDNLYNEQEVTGAMRNKAFTRLPTEGKVHAYKKVQYGTKADGVDAEDTAILRSGNYKDNGQ